MFTFYSHSFPRVKNHIAKSRFPENPITDKAVTNNCPVSIAYTRAIKELRLSRVKNASIKSLVSCCVLAVSCCEVSGEEISSTVGNEILVDCFSLPRFGFTAALDVALVLDHILLPPRMSRHRRRTLMKGKEVTVVDVCPFRDDSLPMLEDSRALDRNLLSFPACIGNMMILSCTLLFPE